MFAGLTGDKEKERQREAFFLERLRNRPDLHVEVIPFTALVPRPELRPPQGWLTGDWDVKA